MDSSIVLLFLGLLAACGNLLGGLLAAAPRWDGHKHLKSIIAIGAGFMLSAVMLRMIPESLQLAGSNGAWLLLSGYLLVHFCEHSLVPHFHYGEETHADEVAHGSIQAYAVLFGLVVHAVFDGVCISSGFKVRPALGILLFLAVMLHKLPEGATIASLMLVTGHRRRSAVLAAGFIGVATLVGVSSIAFWFKHLTVPGLALSSGVTLYVAATDLMPMVNEEKGVKMAFLVYLGVLCFVGTELILEGCGL